MQLPAIKHSKLFNGFLVNYYSLPDHPLKLRIISLLEKIPGRKRIVVKTKFNFKFSIDREDVIQRGVLHEKIWEKELTHFLNKEIKPEDVFYDIGANVGYFSCLAQTIRAKKVVSFEPDPLNVEIINFNYQLNGFDKNNPVILNIALGEKSATSKFYRSNSANTGISGLIKNYESDNYESEFMVEVNAIDNLIEKGLERPTIMKIDTEGYELFVLKGAKNLLSTHPPGVIIFEANTVTEFTEVKTFLSTFGYIKFDLLNDAYGLNYIAYHSSYRASI